MEQGGLGHPAALEGVADVRGRTVGVVLVCMLALTVTACRAPARDMPVVVTPDGSGGAVVAFPVCADEQVKSVLVARERGPVRWSVDQSTAGRMGKDGVVELHFAADGFDGTAQLPGSRIIAGADRAPVSEPFFELLGLDIFAGDGEANFDVASLKDDSSPQWLLSKFPWKDGDVEVETVTEQEGRQRLLAWCES